MFDEKVQTPPVQPVRAGRKTLTSATGDALRSAIQAGRFPPGCQLPPELELMTMLGVSRTTLREAMRGLEEQGLIERRRGLGTYVREQSIMKDLSINFGISEMIHQAGMEPGTQKCDVRTEKSSKVIAAALNIHEGEPIVVLDRVRTSNQRPVVWSMDIMPAALLGEHSIKMIQLETQSLYDYLESQLGLKISRGVAELRAVNANAEMVANLGVRSGAALMRLTQVDYDMDNRVALYSIEYHLPDAFVFLVNRRGPYW